MFKSFVRPPWHRVAVVIAFSIFFLKLPQLMPLAWKWLVVVFICIFFLACPQPKGLKRGIVAGVFSLIFAGLGQLYVREYMRGFLYIVVAVFAYMTANYSAKSWVFNNIVFIVAAIDAFSFGKRGIGIL